MKYCEHCGKSISEDSKFCNYCGSPVFNEYKIRYYLAIIISEQQDTLSSFYDILLNNAVNFTIIDANSIINQKYNIDEEILIDYFNFTFGTNYALLFDEQGAIAGKFNIGSEYSRFKTANFLSNSPYLILPAELLGKKENVIQRYISEKNNKLTLSLKITDCYEDHDHPVGSEVVKSIKEQLDKHDIVNYSVNTLWIEELEYLRDDCEYGIYRPHQVSVGAIALYDGFRVIYGANSDSMLDIDSIPFRVPELMMSLKSPLYKIKQPLDKHEKAERNEHDFLYNKYFMFINITTDRAVTNKEDKVDEDNSHMWPRLSSISWLISDCEGNIKHIEGKKKIILYDSQNNKINSNAHITAEDALYEFYNHINSSFFTIVGHDIELIKKIIMAECYEMKKQETFYDEEEYYWYERLIWIMEQVKSICTMAPVFALMKEDNPNMQLDNLSLREAYNHLFSEKNVPYHDYAISTFNIYSELLHKGRVNNPYSEIIELRNS